MKQDASDTPRASQTNLVRVCIRVRASMYGGVRVYKPTAGRARQRPTVRGLWESIDAARRRASHFPLTIPLQPTLSTIRHHYHRVILPTTVLQFYHHYHRAATSRVTAALAHHHHCHRQRIQVTSLVPRRAVPPAEKLPGLKPPTTIPTTLVRRIVRRPTSPATSLSFSSLLFSLSLSSLLPPPRV